MADALSRKNVMIASFIITTSLIDKISILQKDDNFIKDMIKRIQKGEPSCFQIDNDGTLRLKGRICVPHPRAQKGSVRRVSQVQAEYPSGCDQNV